MQQDKHATATMVRIELKRLNGTILGLVGGLFLGVSIFLATIVLLLQGKVDGPHLALLEQFFVGYTVSFEGSLTGFLYGFISGFGIGYIIAGLYNWMADLRRKNRPGKA
jgi:hypothetical protein